MTQFAPSGFTPPALSAEYHTTVQPADPQFAGTKSVSKLFLSGNGMSRTDFGDTSVITDPTARKTVILDHLKKEARVVPSEPPPLPELKMPEMPTPGAPPPLPTAPQPVSVKDLGKRFLEGHEVEGKQFVFAPPAMPEPPKLPDLPPPPDLPPQPDLPPPPPAPVPQETVSEVWSSTSLMIPMLSRTVSSFGRQILHCKNAVPGEPDPSLFEIPADYKQLENEPQPPDVPPLHGD